jgi:hypothetical protein
MMNKRFFGVALCTLSVLLAGCASEGAFDDSTLLEGKQSWETKRHADDWIQPIADDAMYVCAFIVFAGIEATLDDSCSSDGEPIWMQHSNRDRSEAWRPATLIKIPPSSQKPPISPAPAKPNSSPSKYSAAPSAG